MEVYIGIILLLIIFAFLDLTNIKKEYKSFIIFLIFVLFVLYNGLRWETGTDWYPYKDYFEAFGRWRPPFEIGYAYLNNIVYFFSHNYSVFLVVHAIIIYALYMKSINDYTKYPLLTAFCFFSLTNGYMGMNRQHIALAICLFAFRYIATRDFWRFFLLVIFASLFHFSAIIFLITYFLNRKIPIYSYVLLLLFAVVLNPLIAKLMSPLVALANYHFWIAAKIARYATAGGGTNSALNITFGVIKRLLLFFPVYLNIDKLEKKIPQIRLMLNIYFISIFIYIMFNNSLQSYVARGSLYFGNIFEVFLWPGVIFLFSKKDMRCFVYAMVSIMLILSASRALFVSIFNPYKGIFINTEYSRTMELDKDYAPLKLEQLLK